MKENKHGCLGYIGDYTTQLYGDSNKPLKGSLPNNQDSMERIRGLVLRGSSEEQSTGRNVIGGGLYDVFSFFSDGKSGYPHTRWTPSRSL